MRVHRRFSPLHEGDTSVAHVAGHRPPDPASEFQSPSRGGHLRGVAGCTARPSAVQVSVPFTRGTPPWRCCEPHARSRRRSVSVPFTRGTPPWHLQASCDELQEPPCFSPLHEGDTSVARSGSTPSAERPPGFSPLREGDTSVACARCPAAAHADHVSVPFTRGTPPWRWPWVHRPDVTVLVSVPFTRGTPPWRAALRPAAHGRLPVSVPFTRGTPPWRRLRRRTVPGQLPFQSPSRGGHLRGAREVSERTRRQLSFSPLHEGDTSVAGPRSTEPHGELPVSVPFTRGTPPWRASAPQWRPADVRFQSPSRGGHLRGAAWSARAASMFLPFQSPSRGGHLRGPTMRSSGDRRAGVSVPFTRGTPPWRAATCCAAHAVTSVSVPFTRGTPPWPAMP